MKGRQHARYALVAASSLLANAAIAHGQPTPAPDPAIESESDTPAAFTDAIRRKLSGLTCPGTLRVQIVPGTVSSLHIERIQPGKPKAERTVPLYADERADARLAAHIAFNLCNDEADGFLHRTPPIRVAAGDTGVERAQTTDTPARASGDAAASSPPFGPGAERESTIATRTAAGTLPPLGPAPCGYQPFTPLSVDLFSPVGIPYDRYGTRRSSVSLALLYGASLETRGAAFGGLMYTTCAATGVSATMVAAITNGLARGVFVSAGLTWHSGELEGVTIAPLNVARNGDALQLGAINLAFPDKFGLSGAQIGIINVGTQNLRGAQIGVINVQTGTTYGAQVGVVNVGREVLGTQVGVLNVARDSSASFGIQSISWARKVRPYAWTSTVTPLQLGLQWDAKTVFAGLNFGRLLQSIVSEGNLSLGFEFGIHLLKAERSGLIADFLLGLDGQTSAKGGRVLQVARTGLRGGYRFFPRFAPYLYAGVATLDEADPDFSRPTFAIRPELGGGVLF
jgi:hypothetical protein